MMSTPKDTWLTASAPPQSCHQFAGTPCGRAAPQLDSTGTKLPSCSLFWPWLHTDTSCCLANTWSTAGGVLHNVSSTITAIIIEEGAHHLDLMFSHPADPPSVKAARQYELSLISAWLDAYYTQENMPLRRAQLSQSMVQ